MLTVQGQILHWDPADFSVALVSLALAFAPFHVTVRRLLRTYQRWTGERLSYRSGVKAIAFSAVNRRPPMRPSVERSHMEEPPEPFRAAVESGLWVTAVLLVIVRFRAPGSIAIVIGLAGVIAGLTGYCLESARPHASPNWRPTAQLIPTPIPIRHEITTMSGGHGLLRHACCLRVGSCCA